MSRVVALKQRASHSLIKTLLAVIGLYSGLVAAGLYAVFVSDYPGLSALLSAWAPMVSAGLTVWLCDESVRDWLCQFRNLRVEIHWYLVGIGILVLGTESENIVAVLLGSDAVIPAHPLMTYVYPFTVTLFLAGALEELGWRGLLQPRLQQRFSAFQAITTNSGFAIKIERSRRCSTVKYEISPLP